MHMHAQYKSPTLKCYRNRKIKTEKLRNTNMLDKCRNVALAKTVTLSLIEISSLRNSDSPRPPKKRCLGVGDVSAAADDAICTN